LHTHSHPTKQRERERERERETTNIVQEFDGGRGVACDSDEFGRLQTVSGETLPGSEMRSERTRERFLTAGQKTSQSRGLEFAAPVNALKENVDVSGASVVKVISVGCGTERSGATVERTHVTRK
jgi:hypothetical protein